MICISLRKGCNSSLAVVRAERGRRALAAVIDTREADLLSTACALGERFYCIKPAEFAGRIAEYFEELGRPRKCEARQVGAEL